MVADSLDNSKLWINCLHLFSFGWSFFFPQFSWRFYGDRVYTAHCYGFQSSTRYDIQRPLVPSCSWFMDAYVLSQHQIKALLSLDWIPQLFILSLVLRFCFNLFSIHGRNRHFFFLSSLYVLLCFSFCIVLPNKSCLW